MPANEQAGVPLETQQVFTWPTPNLKDSVFYVTRDWDIPANQKWQYGDPYKDKVKYPNHKLVYVSPQDGNHISKWYYANDREDQDEYNWEHSVADLGKNKFSAINRSYVFPRADYDPLEPKMGSPMPAIPQDEFSEEFIMAFREELRTNEPELDSVFIVEKRTYIKRVTITEMGIREKTGKSERVVTTVYYRGETVSEAPVPDTVEALFDDKDNAYWGAQEDGSFRDGKQISENWFTISLRIFVDLEPDYKIGGSRFIPRQFFCPDATTTVVTTEVTAEGQPDFPTIGLGQEVIVQKSGTVEVTTTTTQTGSPGALPGLNALDDGYAYASLRSYVNTSSVPTTRQSINSGGQITEYSAVDPCSSVMDRRQLISPETEFTKIAERLAPDKFFEQGLVTTEDEVAFNNSGTPADPSADLNERKKIVAKGKIIHTITTSQKGSPIAVSSTTFDERVGASFVETQEVVQQSAVAPATVGTDGTIDLFTGVDANWAVKTNRKVADTAHRTWTDVVNYEWPPVLTAINLTVWSARNDRGSVVYPDIVFKKGFSGPQVAQVEQWWQRDPYTITPPVQMIPEAMTFQSPLFSVSVPPCLHGDQVFFCNIGTNDPEWESQSYTREFAATNYTDWPESITWEAVQPYRGGYLVTSYTLNRPS